MSDLLELISSLTASQIDDVEIAFSHVFTCPCCDLDLEDGVGARRPVIVDCPFASFVVRGNGH